MSTLINWEGHQIEIVCRLSGKYLLLATENIVKVDGSEVARSGGFSFTDLAIGSFQHNNDRVQIELSTGAAAFTTKYVLRVNGIIISQGRLGIENIALGCLLGLIGGALGFYLVYMMLRVLSGN